MASFSSKKSLQHQGTDLWTGGTLRGTGNGKKSISFSNVNAVKAAASYRQKIEFAYDPIDLVPYKAVGILLPFNKSCTRLKMLKIFSWKSHDPSTVSVDAGTAAIFNSIYHCGWKFVYLSIDLLWSHPVT